MSPARRRLAIAGATFLGLNVLLLTPVAILVNLPAQFGGPGTDAGQEFLGRGTAISAPLAPLVFLGAMLALLGRDGGWALVGVLGIGIVAVLVLIGALGEALAPATQSVSRSVLIASGLGVGSLAACLLGLSAAALAEHRRSPQAG